MPSIRSLLVAPGLALALIGCAARDDSALMHVRVTASGKAVEKCENVGPVAQISLDHTIDNNIEQMQRLVAQRGGNTLLVNSYAIADVGTAYACHPALDPKDPRVMPSADDGTAFPGRPAQ